MSDMLSQKRIDGNLYPRTSSGHRIVVMEVNYRTKCDEKFKAAKSLVDKGELPRALNMLLKLEIQTRTGYDMESTRRVLVTMVQICFGVKEWKLLNEVIALLSKKPTQFEDAVIAMVKECITYIEHAPNDETKIRLIRTIRIVTEDLEVLSLEHASLTQQLLQLSKFSDEVITIID